VAARVLVREASVPLILERARNPRCAGSTLYMHPPDEPMGWWPFALRLLDEEAVPGEDCVISINWPDCPPLSRRALPYESACAAFSKMCRETVNALLAMDEPMLLPDTTPAEGMVTLRAAASGALLMSLDVCVHGGALTA